jgi:membrane fusion protein (multidrug efflux system)
MIRTKWIFLTFAAILTTFLVCRSIFWKAPPFQGFLPSSVIVNVAEIYDFSDVIEAIGTAKANESVNITSSITQIINKINFEEGQYIEKDEVVIEFSSEEEKATLEEAEKQFHRIESLSQTAATTLARRDQQFLALQIAKARYSDRVVRAPFSGIIGLRHLSEGALVTPGMVITTLDDINFIKLDFSIPEKHAGTIIPGKKIIATTVAYPEKKFEGTIYAVDPRVNSTTRAFNTKAIVSNTDKLLKPGMLLQVKVVLQEEKIMLLPEEAIGMQKDKKFVYVVGSLNKIEQFPVETKRRIAGIVEIVSGIKVGDQIVMEGRPNLRPGQVVQIAGVKTIKESNHEFKNISEK